MQLTIQQAKKYFEERTGLDKAIKEQILPNLIIIELLDGVQGSGYVHRNLN
jgi:hypothetical protein